MLEGQIDVIYTYFEKARVPHKRLLRKLYSYNINEDIKWIKAYLDNRTQRVKLII